MRSPPFSARGRKLAIVLPADFFVLPFLNSKLISHVHPLMTELGFFPTASRYDLDPILSKYFQRRVTIRSNSGLLIGQKKSRDINRPIKMLKFQCSVTLCWKYFYRIGSRIQTLDRELRVICKDAALPTVLPQSWQVLPEVTWKSFFWTKHFLSKRQQHFDCHWFRETAGAVRLRPLFIETGAAHCDQMVSKIFAQKFEKSRPIVN